MAKRARLESSDAPSTLSTRPEEAEERESLGSSEIADSIRALILKGDAFPPGSKISVSMVMELVAGATRITVARAMIHLEYEGLVEILPQSGTYVRDIPYSELFQLWRTRVVLEDFFVSTLARDTRDERVSGLTIAREKHLDLDKLVCSAERDGVTEQTIAESIRLDVAFHEALATAAGYPQLTSQLQRVRNQIRLGAIAAWYAEQEKQGGVTAQVRPSACGITMTESQLRAIVEEHGRILEAIRTPKSSLIGDVVQARLAISVHLRNSLDRLAFKEKLEVLEDTPLDPIWDVPAELTPAASAGASEGVTVLRMLLELLVAAELSRQPTMGRLSLPEQICSRMGEIANSCDPKLPVPDSVKTAFITYDIRFHESMAFLSGLMFADEAISHIWHLMYDHANKLLTVKTMQKVVEEHTNVLGALRFFGANRKEPHRTRKVLEYVLRHLLNAHWRSRNPGKDEPVTEPATEALPGCVKDFLNWYVDELATDGQNGAIGSAVSP